MAESLIQLLTFSIDPARRVDYLVALAEVLVPARQEPANVFLHTTEFAGAPGRFVFLEKWRDQDEFVNEIQQRDYYLHYVATAWPLLLGPPEITRLNPVPETSRHTDLGC
jgi:quinol monooxygenase YgiN